MRGTFWQFTLKTLTSKYAICPCPLAAMSILADVVSKKCFPVKGVNTQRLHSNILVDRSCAVKSRW